MVIDCKASLPLFNLDPIIQKPRLYGDILSVSLNAKGVIDVDTVKGCKYGMIAYPETGCYGECYANKIALRYGIDFKTSVSRKLADPWQHRDVIIKQLLDYGMSWYRIGVMGDPCHDWDNTLNIINSIRYAKKTAVIVTKHWITLSNDHISRLKDMNVVIQTSTSGLDTDNEIIHRVEQIYRLKNFGIPSINRVVTCEYGNSLWAERCKEKQNYLLTVTPIINNPLRASASNNHVVNGDIITITRDDSIGGGNLVSLYDQKIFLGYCTDCPDQCGIELASKCNKKEFLNMQATLFDKQDVEVGSVNRFKYVPSVIGSGYETEVATLALEDGIAHRAARKNMQIHSAIILLINDRFAGFFTFQNNHNIGEFCLLQSVIKPEYYTPELYKQMAQKVIEQNTSNYPMLMTTNPKSKFETPELFKSLGFHTYLAMSGFEYMLSGDPSYSRMKTLAHITMTNVWDSVKGDWLKLKKIWNENIDKAGEINGVENPSYATREGCWQGESGFANVVTGRSHNGNASVLDPVACEIILRFFTPIYGKRVYNPFGGGVQFGYVAGASGYEYLASEIRNNQCDANNKICSEFKQVKWVQGDSSTYHPDGKFDLIFTCPPYYKVEKYIDYDGNSPSGEINSLSTYEDFRNTLFKGYEVAIEHLNDNRFFVVMTGDSRDKYGGYYCHESETELFFKEHGLSVYNKIIYLEAEFTRLAQAKKTLHARKFPKREQKIIVAYKGSVDMITKEFASIGRL